MDNPCAWCGENEGWLGKHRMFCCPECQTKYWRAVEEADRRDWCLLCDAPLFGLPQSDCACHRPNPGPALL